MYQKLLGNKCNSKFSINNPVILVINTILFGCHDIIVCQFMFTAKQCIHYKRRQTEAPPEVKPWWAYQAKIEATKLGVVRKNNTVDHWKEKWKP